MMNNVTFTLQVSEAQFRAVEAWTAREEQERLQSADLKIQSEEFQRKISELKERNSVQARMLGELHAIEATRDAAQSKCEELTRELATIKQARTELAKHYENLVTGWDGLEQKVVVALEERDALAERCSMLEKASLTVDDEWKEVSEECDRLMEERRGFEHKVFSLEKELSVLQTKSEAQKRQHSQAFAQKDGEVATYIEELDKAHAMSKSVVKHNRELEEQLEEQNETNEQLERKIEDLERQLAAPSMFERENAELRRKLAEAERAIQDNLPQYTIVVEPKHKRSRTDSDEHLQLVTNDFAPFDIHGEFDQSKFLDTFEKEIHLAAF